MSVEQATQLLQSAGFTVQVNKYGPLDKVFDFSPVGQAPRGSTITLDVGYLSGRAAGGIAYRRGGRSGGWTDLYG
jgi:beta-lactam-binding protein with PASTA domain